MNVISLDIETYGAAKGNHIGVLLPDQTVFHPKKSLYLDGVKNKDLVLTVAITLPKNSTSQTLNFDLLAGLEPGKTMVFEMHNKEHREKLQAWLYRADVIIGMNLQFDLQYLYHTDVQPIPMKAQLVDLSVLNYLHSELREERSLKALGPVLGAFAYSETLKTTRFKRANDQKLLFYNAQDTHNTMLAVAELSRRLLCDKFHDHFDSQHGEYCLNFYSESIWATIAMSHAGVPMSSLALQDLMGSLEEDIASAEESARSHELILRGPGSATSKDEFLHEVIKLIEEVSNPDIMDALDVTPKSKKVSFSDKNRTTLYEALPEGTDADIYRDLLNVANKHSKAMKLMSSYCYPLLYHRRNKPDDMSSVLIPIDAEPLPRKNHVPERFSTPAERLNAAEASTINTRAHIARFDKRERSTDTSDARAYPTWYVTPSHIKNDTGSAGGTIQGRITCKQPSAQTFPKPIKACIKSVHEGGKIVAMDLSQAELRVAALLSGETSMIEAYQNERDLHAERARSLWGDYDDKPDDQHQRRQVGKMMNFADLFLSSANTMREQVYAQSGGEISIPLPFYQKVVAQRSEVRPHLTSWQKGLLRKVKQDHIIMLPFTGQSRTFLGDLGAVRSEIVNFPVQTTAGNLTLAIQHALMRSLTFNNPYASMFLQIYDAIYIDAHPDHVDRVVDKVNKAVQYVTEEGYWADLQHIYRRRVPLKHDIEILG
ncbi:MAG: hypothetical protein CMH52_14340 [Myxococcales bacterium]|nr:hypothetical protein [Myxococcales bacterium]